MLRLVPGGKGPGTFHSNNHLRAEDLQDFRLRSLIRRRRTMCWRAPASRMGYRAAFVVLLSTLAPLATEQKYSQTGLVSVVAAWAATVDPHLVKAWGRAFGPRDPIWISDNGT